MLLSSLRECLHVLVLRSTIQHLHNGIAIVCVVAYRLSLCMQSRSDTWNIQ